MNKNPPEKRVILSKQLCNVQDWQPLDKLAAFGVRCTIGYVNYPACSPSHCIPTLMTPTSCNSSTAADQFGELSKKVLSRPAIVIAQ